MELTQEERIALIKNAHLASQGKSNASVDNFVEEVKKQEVEENGLFNVANADIEDEKQFLHSDVAEDIDEEDQDMGCVSDQMKGIYQ